MLYRLTGFDRKTERLALEFEIPPAKVRHAKKIAGIERNPAIFADWPLSRDQARALADFIGVEIDPDRYDWALEPYPAEVSPG
jgi:hypothetical protein